MKFYDRKNELELIKKANRVAVVGRRRIGKTRLLQEAMPQQFVYLFFYQDAAETFIAEKWTASIKKTGLYIPTLNKIGDILEYLFQNADMPIVIDEIQNAVKKFPHFISLLQQLMDTFKEKKTFITGSLISVMKKVVEDYKSPIFGRFDFIIKLNELDIKTILEIMADLGYSLEQALKYYSVFGGIPKYYELIETLKPEDFNEFINLMFFKYPRPLFNEILIMLKEEIGKEFSNYFGLLHAVSQKGITFGTIASALNMVSTSVSKYLNTLMKDYELVRKEQPLSKKKKRTHYLINSNIIDFWFTYCFSQWDSLDRGDEAPVYEKFKRHFPSFYGKKLESVIVRGMPGFLEKKGIAFSAVGKDWGNDYEFDFVVENGETIYIGEIKAGDLNAAAELKKIESITQREIFYRDRKINYIFIAERFSRKVRGDHILYVTIPQFFEQIIK